MREVFLVSAVRTAIGTFGGSLKDVAPSDLATKVTAEALARSGVSIQLHTHTHHLPSENFDEMAEEIAENRSAITQLTGIAPTHF